MLTSGKVEHIVPLVLKRWQGFIRAKLMAERLQKRRESRDTHLKAQVALDISWSIEEAAALACARHVSFKVQLFCRLLHAPVEHTIRSDH
jgi:hypothetical protein